MKREPCPGSLRSSTRPPCASAIARTIASPSPAPSERRAGGLAAREALEHALAVGRRDARAVVLDPQPQLAGGERAAERDPVASRGVLDGVLREAHHRLGEPLAVGADLPERDRLALPAPRRERGRLRHQLVRELVDVDVLQPQEVGPLGLRERQQVVDEAAHPVQLVGDEGDRLAPLLGVLAQQLEMAADDRDRRAQLVARVGDEVALAGERGLQPVEHGVERAASSAISSWPSTSIRCVRSLEPIARAAASSSRSGASTRPAITKPSTEASSSTASATPAATWTASVTSAASCPTALVTTNAPRTRPSAAHRHREVADAPLRAGDVAAAHRLHVAERAHGLEQLAARRRVGVGAVRAPVEERERRLALVGDVARQEGVEDAVQAVAEPLAGARVAGIGGEAAELGDLLHDALLAARVDAAEQDLAQGDVEITVENASSRIIDARMRARAERRRGRRRSVIVVERVVSGSSSAEGGAKPPAGVGVAVAGPVPVGRSIGVTLAGAGSRISALVTTPDGERQRDARQQRRHAQACPPPSHVGWIVAHRPQGARCA